MPRPRSHALLRFTADSVAEAQIDRSAADCFEAYAQLQRMPEWCTALGRVDIVSPSLSEWSVRLPPTLSRIVPPSLVRWTSELELDSDACRIAWRSVSGVETSGEAVFTPRGVSGVGFEAPARPLCPLRLLRNAIACSGPTGPHPCPLKACICVLGLMHPSGRSLL